MNPSSRLSREKRRCVVRPYAVTRYGVRRTVYANSERPPSQAAVPFETTTLSCTTPNSGNRKDPTPFQFTKTVLRNHPSREEYIDNSPANRSYVTTGYRNADPGISAPNFENEVYNECLEALANQVRGSLDLSVDLAEGHQTAKLVKSLYSLRNYVRATPSQVLRYVLDWRASPGYAAGRVPAIVANKYLQWKYGVKPLVQSVYESAAEVLRHLKGEDAYPLRIRVRRSKTTFGERVYDTDGGIVSKYRYERSDRCQMICFFSLPDSTVTNLGRFTSLNPVSLAYELMTLSFVADYVYNVGQYLRNAETSIAYSSVFRKGSMTRSSKEYIYGSKVGVKNFDDGTQLIFERVGSSRLTTSMDRSVLTGYPAPLRPTFKMDLGASQAFTVAALLTQFGDAVRRGAR